MTKTPNLQDIFLSAARRGEVPLTVFLVNGFQMRGTITGFANAVASPAIDFKSEGLITGMAAKMFTVAGPVIVFGVAASAVYGVFLMVNQLGWW